MKKLFILFLSVFFWRCNSQPKIVPVKLQAEELEVIKQTFPYHDRFAWTTFDCPKFPPKGWHQTKQQKEKAQKKINSAKANQPKKLIWFVKDTLFNPADFRSSDKYYYDSRIKLDTVFFNLEKALFTAVYPKQAAYLSSIISENYVFASADSIKKVNKIPERYVAITRVVFNPNHTKACYYVSYSHFLAGRIDGNADMLFVEKKYGIWFLKYIKPYWTS